MPKKDTTCTEILNEIISRYSKSVFEDSKGNSSGEQNVNRVPNEEFWPWFCESIKEERFRKCFEGSKRTDFYGSLGAVRKEYKEMCE